MSSSSESVDYLIDCAERWYINAEGGFIAAFTEFDGNLIKYDVSSTELAEVHSFLPQLVTVLVRENQAKGIPFAQGACITHTLAVLREGIFECKNLQGETLCFTNVFSISKDKKAPYLSGVTVTLGSTLIDGHSVQYVASSSFDMHAISKEDLDERYPGWAERAIAGEALDLPTEELNKHIFSTPAETAGLNLPSFELN